MELRLFDVEIHSERGFHGFWQYKLFDAAVNAAITGVLICCHDSWGPDEGLQVCHLSIPVISCQRQNLIECLSMLGTVVL